MFDPRREAEEWLLEAKRDYEDAEKAFKDGNCIRSRFYSQQAAEKVIKAVYYLKGRVVRGHNLRRLLKGLAEYGIKVDDLLEDVDKLSIHFTATRYPNARRVAGIRLEDYNEQLAHDCLRRMGRVWERMLEQLT